MSHGQHAGADAADGAARLELIGVSKAFGATAALEDVSLTLRAGEVHCLAGENGAGKSTLIRILTGAVRRDGGVYRLEGIELGHPTPAEAQAAGVAVVYQELSVLPELSVEDNLVMGRFPARRGLLRRAEIRATARAMLDRVGLHHVDPRTLVSDLPVSARQLLEIAQALGRNARVVIFDEPTTALAEADAAALLAQVKALRDHGVSVLYVTHRLEEMFEVGDRVTVLKDGRVSRTGPMRDFDHDSLIDAMVGRPIRELYPAHDRAPGEVVLRARDLRPTGSRAPSSVEVRRGEIVALAGLVGSGRTELLHAIFGVAGAEHGSVEVGGVEVSARTPARMKRAGVALVPEDRKEDGLLLELSVRENVSIAGLARMSAHGVVSRRRERAAITERLRDVRLKAASPEAPMTSLSGGNQQKALLARCLVTDAKVLLLDEPTKGVDIGAKSEIYRLIGDLARAGVGVLFVSSYLPEVLGLADRIVVLRDGAIAGVVSAAETTEEQILRLASPTSQIDHVEV